MMKNKKELTPMKITNYYWGIVTLLFIILIILLSGCEEDTVEYRKPECYTKLTELSCEEIQECYDLCDGETIINWRMDCRDKFKPYLWKCYGSPT